MVKLFSKRINYTTSLNQNMLLLSVNVLGDFFVDEDSWFYLMGYDSKSLISSTTVYIQLDRFKYVFHDLEFPWTNDTKKVTKQRVFVKVVEIIF